MSRPARAVARALHDFRRRYVAWRYRRRTKLWLAAHKQGCWNPECWCREPVDYDPRDIAKPGEW